MKDTLSLINPNVIKILNGPMKEFYRKIKANDTVNGTVEILEFNDWFDPRYEYIDYFDIRKASRKYIENEKNWYMSFDKSIKGHPGIETNKIWQYCASKDDKQEINSQYGYLVFSPENGVNDKSQYELCFNQLISDKNTRQAGMIYMRPTIYKDYCENGKHDFICTTEIWCHIRNNKLFYSVNMRSNDFFTGFVNDWAWHYFVYHKLYQDLLVNYPDLEIGYIYWHASSFHVYERNYQDIINIYEKYLEVLENKTHHVYKVTHVPSGQSYIGQCYDSAYEYNEIWNDAATGHNTVVDILEFGDEENIDELENKWFNS